MNRSHFRATSLTLSIPAALAALCLTAAPAAAQADACGAATPITGTGSFFVSTIGATDSGMLASCNDQGAAVSRDVWFRWTSGPQTDYRFDLCSTNFDTVVSLWDSCGGSEIECSATATCGTPGAAELSLPGLQPNTTYWIQVDGLAGATGIATLEISTATVPSNDDCGGAASISGTGLFQVDNLGATSSFTSSSCQFGLDKDVWYSWTSGPGTDYVFRICGQGTGPILSLYDSCGSPEVECQAFGGCTTGGNGVELVATGLIPNTTYLLQVSGANEATFNNQMEIIDLVLPTNDTCQTAIPISGPGPFAWDAAFSTDTVISWCTTFAVRDIWYEWTSGNSTNYIFDSTGNGFGVNMILRPDCVQNPIGCTGNGTIVATNITPNTTYILQIEGASGDLTITPGNNPPNDDCANATPITGFGSYPFAMLFASAGAEPAAACNFTPFGNVDVWYEWTAPSTNASFAVCGNSASIGIAVYDQCGGMEIGCSSNGGCSPSTTSAQLDLMNLTPGATYLVQVDSRGFGEAGALEISPLGGGTPIGTPYCASLPNSTGLVASLQVAGSTSIAAGLLRLEASDLPSGVIGIFYYGTNQTAVPFGNGLRCVSGVVQRLPFRSANGAGTLNEFDVYSLPQGNLPIAVGTRNFQAWFRDPTAGGFGFNLSGGVSVTFVP